MKPRSSGAYRALSRDPRKVSGSESSRQFRGRVRALALFMCLGVVLVVFRAQQLQLWQHEDLSKKAQNEYLLQMRVAATRGRIFDRNADQQQPLASSVDVPSVHANPSEVVDPRPTARALQKLLNVDLDTIYRRLASDKVFVWVKRRISPNLAERVRAAKLKGVHITQEPRRYYPNRTLAAHVLGFAGIDGHGLEGLERSYDKYLHGESQVVRAMRDGRGRSVLSGNIDPNYLTRGADIQLSIDRNIQHAAETALAEAVKTSKAKAGHVVVLDVQTADVLAMAVLPTFNPNEVGRVSASNRRNRAVTDMYEPGSTFKPLIVAAALEASAVKPDELIFCENGMFKIGRHTIHDGHPAAWLDLTHIIQKSSNIGAAKVGTALGRERMAEYLGLLGFGKRTGIGLPGESHGRVRAYKTWSDVGLATISFGHGIAVTGLQLATAYRTLAAGGMYRQPRLVRSIRFADGRSVKLPGRTERRVFSASVTARVGKMMEAATSAEGTGWRASIDGYAVAGKTGTAQKFDHVAGTYSHEKFVAVFAGFVPAETPRVVIAVAIDEPQGAYTGGEVSAPVFAQVAAASMRVLAVPPRAEPVRIALQRARQKALDSVELVEAVDAGSIDNTLAHTDRLQAALTRLVSTKPADSAAGPGTGKSLQRTPSFLGLSPRAALIQHERSGVGGELHFEGDGVVVAQSPAAGKSPAQTTLLKLGQR